MSPLACLLLPAPIMSAHAQYSRGTGQCRYGHTPSGKHIDAEAHAELLKMGFEHATAAEALKQASMWSLHLTALIEN